MTAIALVGLLFPFKINGDGSPGLLWINPLESLPDKPNAGSIKSALSYISVKYGLNQSELYKTLMCESGLRVDAKNPNSSAYGIAQFIKSTWDTYCEGDRTDTKAQLRCMAEMWQKGMMKHWKCWKPYLSN